MTMNVTSGVTIKVAVTIRALRTLPRNRNRITTTSTMPSSSALYTVSERGGDQLDAIVERHDAEAVRQDAFSGGSHRPYL